MADQVRSPAVGLPSLDSGNLVMAVGVVGILLVMIVPLPPFILDILLTFSLTFGLVILLMAMYSASPLDFSVFPSLLLITTLFRLSLNVASTRLILSYGNEGAESAGQVIKAFGTFVIGGNYVIGAIVFFIMVVINFVVITKGAGRIAEVAARFTLDAMPGKQMSIDADLNAGLIDDREARRRRAEIARESEFYGAMDGASKFVRGEAIASIIIIFVNILGGILIGVFQKGLPVVDAVQNYTLLTIGDGLVAQIPALVISTAAGILVSRAASEVGMGREFANQFGSQIQAMGVASGIIFFFGLIPGLPHIPFILFSAAIGSLAFFLYRSRQASEAGVREEAPAAKSTREPEIVESILPLDTLSLEVGYGLIPLVDEKQGGDLLERIRALRRQFALDMGLIVPPIHIRDNLQLKPGNYAVLIRGIEVARGELLPGYHLAMDAGEVKRKVEGIPTTEPAFNLPALWITDKVKEEAQLAGYTVVDMATVVATHLTEVIRSHADELLGRQEVQKLLDNLAKTNSKAVEEANTVFSLGGLQKVLQNLLRERISIRDLLTVVETIADYAPITKDPDILTEYVRQKLARSITKEFLTPEGTLPVLALSQNIEDVLREGIQRTEQGTFLSIEPNLAQRIISYINRGAEQCLVLNYQPIVLCSPIVRRHLRRLVERFVPNVLILSHNELSSDMKVQSVGIIELGHED
ncbi:MAG: flagellar biosynthesis protein FlhA [Deltaproteobacteria bacterium]|nr:MAG: flagellar biosynthesis protein FlhA [Deltaproteobacteria bacterium]